MTAAAYDPAAFPPFAVTVDIVLLRAADELTTLVVRRGGEPFAGKLALPGGFVHVDESIQAAAERELWEETGVRTKDLRDIHLEQVGTFGDVDRDPRMRVVSVAYLALTPNQPPSVAGSDAAEAIWIPVREALATPLAFDHNTILNTCVERARAKLEYTNLATTLAGTTFTLADLHRIYEVVWNAQLDLPNFRRKVLAADGFIEPTGTKRAGASGGPAASLYRPGKGTTLIPPIMRPVTPSG